MDRSVERGRKGTMTKRNYFARKIETRLVKDPNFPYSPKVSFTNPRVVYDFVRDQLQDSDIEKLVVLFTDSRNNLVGLTKYDGTVDQVAIFPREFIKTALLTGAVGMILIHNHPSGYLEPSPPDKELTLTVRSMCKLFSICFHDHLIVGEKGFYSFIEERQTIIEVLGED